MGIGKSFLGGYRTGYEMARGPERGERSTTSKMKFEPHVLGFIGEQLRGMCGDCKNSKDGLGKGSLWQGGTVAVFSCVKQRPGDCNLVKGVSAPINRAKVDGLSVIGTEVTISKRHGTQVSVSYEG